MHLGQAKPNQTNATEENVTRSLQQLQLLMKKFT
jgi:hypothetical protein